MKKIIYPALLYIVVFSSIYASTDFTSIVLGDSDNARKPSAANEFFSCRNVDKETPPNPDRSLGSKIKALNMDNFLRENNAKLNWIRPPYIQQETYTRLEDELMQIQESFQILENDYCVLFHRDGYLTPLSEPNKKAADDLRKMSASVSKKLQLITMAVASFQVDLDSVIAQGLKK